MFEHRFPVRVYYADTDAQGIVYHAQYLRFLDQARVEFLRSLGFGLKFLLKQVDVQFSVHRIEISYERPAYLDDQLIICSQVAEVRQASLLFEQVVYLDSEGSLPICRANVRLACLGSNMKLKAIPKDLKMEILS